MSTGQNSLTYNQYMRLRIWLKIGLVQEKKGAYDSAAASYTEAASLARTYFESAGQSNDTGLNPEASIAGKGELHFLKLYFQPHFCLAYLQEKMASNAHGNVRSIDSFIEILRQLVQQEIGSSSRNYTRGNLVFFYSDCLNKAGEFHYLKGFGPADACEEDNQFLNKAIEIYYLPAMQFLLTHYFSKSACKTDHHSIFFNNILKVLFDYVDVDGEISNRFSRAQPADIYALLALILSNLGDTFLSKLTKQTSKLFITRTIEFFNCWTQLNSSGFENTDWEAAETFEPLSLPEINRCIEKLVSAPGGTGGEDEDKKNDESLTRVILCYLAAARCYLRAAMHKECAFEYEKILRILYYCRKEPKDYNQFELKSIPELIQLLEKHIYESAEKYYRLAYSNVHHSLFDASLQKEPHEVSTLGLLWLRLKDNLVQLIKVAGSQIGKRQSRAATFSEAVASSKQLAWHPEQHATAEGTSGSVGKAVPPVPPLLPDDPMQVPPENDTDEDEQPNSSPHSADEYLLPSDLKEFIQTIDDEVKVYLNTISQDDHFDNVLERIYRLSFKTHKLAQHYREDLLGIPKTKSKEIVDVRKEDTLLEKYINQGDDSTLQDRIENAKRCIKEGMFCCYHSIILRELHSSTFWWLHLGRAFMHKLLADWVRRYKKFLEIIGQKNFKGFRESDLKQEIERYIDLKNMKYVNYEFQLQEALENFHQVKETHTCGGAYKSLLQRLYYLDDDFNDRIYHFYLAKERFAIGGELVDASIRKLRILLNTPPRTQTPNPPAPASKIR
ncbi:hypothetical protein JXJ21_20990 [candidate division KSB1 bacterium]|nr:hypothetical protein [candidate division KSB1 bacterium]